MSEIHNIIFNCSTGIHRFLKKWSGLQLSNPSGISFTQCKVSETFKIKWLRFVITYHFLSCNAGLSKVVWDITNAYVASLIWVMRLNGITSSHQEWGCDWLVLISQDECIWLGSIEMYQSQMVKTDNKSRATRFKLYMYRQTSFIHIHVYT